MSTELAMNAYVLLGNALHGFMNGKGGYADSGLSPVQVRELNSKLEPLPPSKILEAVAAVTAEERMLLGDLCRSALREMGGEAEALLGVPRDVAEQTLAELGL